ncbi:MAG: type II secretion system protein GspG [Roseateles depolymerans]|uniref:Type II secretion system core protein G n=1 Tax=Roseateles depolymerans TaxID=76731 RepID=A0A2W5DAD0_9BURK|nr:MAG: type II secretion system protein GspG [Roseateles depolymerans]
MNSLSIQSRPRSAGFTLLELLVVLVIIGLLGSLVGPKLFGKADAAKIQTAQTQVKMLKGALETMRLDIGRFPTASEGLALLNEAPKDERIAARWKGPYLDETLPQDPWGNAYQYAVPGANGQAVAIYSFGADGKRGGEGNDADIGILPP